LLDACYATDIVTRNDLRDGTIADVGHHPPLDLLASSSELEPGVLVGQRPPNSDVDDLRLRLQHLDRSGL
jgi:hypothetical protein